MPTMRLLWKRVYTAVATARWSVLLMVAAAHFLTSWLLLAAAGETDLTGHAATFFYYYMVTATTVGYGDLSPAADAGRIAASLYVVPIAIAIFTAIIGKAITDITSYLRKNHMGMGSYAKKNGHVVIIGWQGDRTRRLIEGLIHDNVSHEHPVLVSSSLAENPMPSEIDFISVETLSDGRGLERAGITCNKNGIPFDPEKPMVTSGIRLGTPAATTRGFRVEEFQLVGNLISDVLDGLAANREDNSAAENAAGEQVLALCRKFPVYSNG